MKKIVIVDYGFGNLFSLAKALTHLGASPVISEHAGDIREADAVILPGVGAFGDGMAELKKRGLVEALVLAAGTGKPLLGICLGMQFLFEKSFEFGEHAGLGILKGVVKEIEISKAPFCKIPHVGWNSLVLPEDKKGEKGAKEEKNWKNEILKGINIGAETYFVHSFSAYPTNPEDVVANTCYCEAIIPSVVARGSAFGVQFHPEKSGEVGISILKNFLSFV